MDELKEKLEELEPIVKENGRVLKELACDLKEFKSVITNDLEEHIKEDHENFKLVRENKEKLIEMETSNKTRNRILVAVASILTPAITAIFIALINHSFGK